MIWIDKSEKRKSKESLNIWKDIQCHQYSVIPIKLGKIKKYKNIRNQQGCGEAANIKHWWWEQKQRGNQPALSVELSYSVV